MFWVITFVELRGLVALTSILVKIHRRRVSGPEIARSSASGENSLDREYQVVACLKALMRSKPGSDDALKHQHILDPLATCLTSPRLTTKQLASEVLTSVCLLDKGAGRFKVLRATGVGRGTINGKRRFDAWMRTVDVTIGTCGKTGSLRSKSRKLRSSRNTENMLVEYIIATLVLINTMISTPETECRTRFLIFYEFKTSGIKKIMTKMEGFRNEAINKQVKTFRHLEDLQASLVSRYADSEGLVVVEHGWIADKSGDRVGLLVEGDLRNLIGRAVNNNGYIIDKEKENFIGYAKCFEETDAELEPIKR